MRYYISDLHFFHQGINERMDNRGFADADAMNEYMINQWNSRVRRNDEVVILGDLSLGNAEQTNEIVDRLKGRLFLITGNHDKFLREKDFNTTRFKWIKEYAEMNDNSRKVILCHYPVFCYNGQFRRDEQGNPKVWMLHGHVHNTQDCVLLEKFKNITREYLRMAQGYTEPIPTPCQMINCFCMNSNYVPLTLDEWIKKEKNGELNSQIQLNWSYRG